MFEKFRRLSRLLDDAEPLPEAAFLQGLKSQFQTLEQRVNLLEAYLQSEGGRGKGGNLDAVQSALSQLGASIQGTVQLLQTMQSTQKRNDEAMKTLKERLDKAERSIQSLSIKDA